MDDNLRKEVLDVRKVIEKSTSKVSLRDLEKKGFRQVKVLRAGDINQLIFKAVQNVMAKQGGGAFSDAERQKIMAEAKADFDRQMAANREIQQKSQQIEEAKVRLEQKVNELNQQIAAEKRAFQDEKAEFQRDKQVLMEKSLEGQQTAAKNYEVQINDLKARLGKSEGGVSREEHEQLTRRYKTQIDDLEQDVDKYRTKAKALQAKVDELERAGATSSGMGANDQELQRMRMEMEQRQNRMQEMMMGIANSLVHARAGGGGGGGDMSDQFKKMQMQISDTIRKATGGGKHDIGLDLTPEQAAALAATVDYGDDQMQTNIKDIEVKEQSAAGVKDKLAKLRNLRKK